MTTSTATTTGGPTFDVEVSKLIAADYNPRVTFENLGELADSIRVDGVLEPLLIRTHPKHPDQFEIIAGHRRAQAAKIAGLKSVPAILLDVGDVAARRICATENLQREDLHPLEEARVIQNLVDDYGAVGAADELGKSLRYVARRSNLLGLSPKWKKAIARDKRIAQFPAPVLDLVALLAPAEQDELLKERFGGRGRIPDLAEVESEVGEYLRTLKRATWKLDDAELVPKQGACTDCTRHSAAAAGLFEDLPGDLAGATCRDLGCWREKATAVAKRKLAAARAEHGDSLVLVAGGWTEMRHRSARGGLGRPELSDWEYTITKKSAKGAVPGFVVTGKGLGTVRWIERGTSSSSTTRSKAKGPKVAPGSADDLKAKRDRLRRRRDGFVVDWIRQQIEDLKVYPRALEQLAALVYVYGVRGAPAHTLAARKKAAAGYIDSLWRAVRGNLASSIMRHSASRLAQDLAEAKWLVGQVWAHVQAQQFLKMSAAAAVEQIPKPKSLVALEFKYSLRGVRRDLKKTARKRAKAGKRKTKTKTARERAQDRRRARK